jgi:beta-glucosidase
VDSEADLEGRVHRLDLTAKVRLLTGATSWRIHGEPSVALREIVVSDGPVGVRGEKWDERLPSVSFPSPTALAASWDVELLRRVGAALAGEARKKDVDVVLGPTVNLHRSPLGGRHFESFSEDPVLTGELGVAYVRGMQAEGVGATPKHYVANDSETDRFTVDVIVDERTLRELYLAPFEAIVHRAQPWLVMAAYNAINGSTATENSLLSDPLETEWGFDGLLVSDWTAVRSTEAAANAATDLAMPGPQGPWGDALVAAVRAGRVPEAAIDAKVLRLLRLASRVGALDGAVPVAVSPVDSAALAREAAAAGTVLVRNEGGLLPLDPAALHEVAVFGPNAVDARTQGGGSATVFPAAVVSPLEGLTAALRGAHVVHHRGVRVYEGLTNPPLATLHLPGSSEPGLVLRLLARDGTVIAEETRRALRVYAGSAGRDGEVGAIELATRYTPVATGRHTVGARGTGALRLHVDGRVIAELAGAPGSSGPGAALFEPAELAAACELVEGVDIDLVLHVDLGAGQTETVVEFVIGEPEVDLDAELVEAGRLAAAADVAVVVVGTTEQIESEGFDRQSLALPGRQDALVRVVAAANPRTVVVVNSGSPVELPWRDDVPAIVLGWFGGQEFGHALADVLVGRREPGGRLPTTWGAATADVPVLSTTPVNGRLEYSEGLHIGYRAWLKAAEAGGPEPAFVFGSGLGYTSWDYESLSVAVTGAVGSGAALAATVRVRNTGSRAGREVVQVYLSRPDSVVDRPVRWLAGFATVDAEPGESVEVPVQIRTRALEYWSVSEHAWTTEPGAFTVHAGHDVATLPLTTAIAVA